jgi:hypothetical protein
MSERMKCDFCGKWFRGSWDNPLCSIECENKWVKKFKTMSDDELSDWIHSDCLTLTELAAWRAAKA